MTIRPATPTDIDAIADIADAHRLRLDGWHPELWPLELDARRRHPDVVRAQLSDRRVHALVAADTKVRGYVIAEEQTTATSTLGTVWAVTEIGVGKPKRWDTVGRVLLAALAERALRGGVAEIVVPCPTGDRRRRAALEGARLEVQCWFRALVVARERWPERFVPTGGDDPGLPLPHLHALIGAGDGATSVTAPGAHALLSDTLPASGVTAMAEGWSLADPVIAGDPEGLWLALEGAERRCRARGDRVLAVAAGPGEGPLDAMLDRRGYARALEWWSWRPKP